MGRAFHRWSAGLTSALVMLHVFNCTCANSTAPGPSAARARNALAVHSCCSRASHSSARPDSPPVKDSPDCPHCHPGSHPWVADEAAVKCAAPTPFDLPAPFLSIDPVAGLSQAQRGLESPVLCDPPPAAPTLLSLHCALTT